MELALGAAAVLKSDDDDVRELEADPAVLEVPELTVVEALDAPEAEVAVVAVVPEVWLVLDGLAAAKPAKAPAAATAPTPTAAVTLDSRRKPRSLAVGDVMDP